MYRWTISQKLPAEGFGWFEEYDLSKFNESFIKNYDKDGDKVYIIEANVEYPKNLHKLYSDLSFLPEKKRELRNVGSLFVRYKTKKTKLFL